HTHLIKPQQFERKIPKILRDAPTIEILKERHPNIFDSFWLYVKCECADKIFSHV
ncbi:15123_t:CDS:1, partial [Funneliformis caledonium]